MRVIFEKGVTDRLREVLGTAQRDRRLIKAFIVSAAEYEELKDLPAEAHLVDPSGLAFVNGRFYMGQVPIYFEGEASIPQADVALTVEA